MLDFLKELGKWTRFAYFLRFALALWIFAPLLCLMNMGDKTLTSGILVSEYWEQYLCVGFFIVSAAFAALVLARVALINGPDRWDLTAIPPDDCRPSILKKVLVNDEGKNEFRAVGVALVPALLVFGYLLYFGSSQEVPPWTIVIGLALGSGLAGIFWWNANAWYYLTFRAPVLNPAPEKFVLGQNIARTILFPRTLFGLNKVADSLPGKPTIEQADSLFSGTAFIRIDQIIGLAALRRFLIARAGYGPAGGSSFYEAHNFATISVVMFSGLYLLIWPLTAPVVAPIAAWIAIGALSVFIAFVLVVFWTAKPAAVVRNPGKLTLTRVWITVTIGVFLFTVIYLFCTTEVERFPVFATVLILMTAACWILGSFAFFFDRYRVPVLTLFLIALVIPRMFHLDRTLYVDGSGIHAGNGQEEHYVSITSTDTRTELPDPQTILNHHPDDGKPLIIVTATGGGLHASAWTATMLARLEKEFGPDFHNHLLLASTVSGGSIGLMAYLSELHQGSLDKPPDLDLARARMESVAQCSSLEGVGWGLVYYDLPKSLVPVIPYFISPSTGDDDLDTNGAWKTALFKDRTWALRKSFLRNLDDRYCRAVWEKDIKQWIKDAKPGEDKSDLVSGWKSQQDISEYHAKTRDETGSGITVRDFAAGAGPAFTMNTTVVETGERFLSANYKIPECRLEDELSPDYRARSFLETFKIVSGGTTWSDLPLASAAQLSATFPYVSSAARAPIIVDNAVNSVHFADGGYYDNDGTASAIEFLRYALGPTLNAPESTAPSTPPCKSYSVSADKPLRILLIEIRNSNGIYGSGSDSSPDHGKKTDPPGNFFSQAVGPLLGFWQAGHESITPRDQSGLELLEHTYSGKLVVESVVLADEWSTDTVGTDPLNWSLTPKQRKEVRESANQCKLGLRITDAKDLFYRSAGWNQRHPIDDSRCGDQGGKAIGPVKE